MRCYLAILFLGIFSVVSIPFEAIATPKKGVQQPRLIVLKMHADWCRTCRRSGPKFAFLRQKLNGKNILFLDLHFTDTSSSRQSEFLLHSLGLTSLLSKGKYKVGVIQVVSGKTKRVLSTLSLKSSIQDLTKQLHLQYLTAYKGCTK